MKKFNLVIVLLVMMFFTCSAGYEGGFCDTQAEWLEENCFLCDGGSDSLDMDELAVCLFILTEHVIFCDQGLDSCDE